MVIIQASFCITLLAFLLGSGEPPDAGLNLCSLWFEDASGEWIHRDHKICSGNLVIWYTLDSFSFAPHFLFFLFRETGPDFSLYKA